MARCLIVLTDGLRPDAITPHRAPHLARLVKRSAFSLDAVTVRPSATVPALTSLATGVSPETHGLTQPGLGFLTRLPSLRPLARELAAAGVPTTAVLGSLKAAAKPVAWALASGAGVGRLMTAAGPGCARVADAAVLAMEDMRQGVVFAYLNDADLAGHRAGWMSAPYLMSVRAVDQAAGRLAGLAQQLGALTIVLADHGGGGVLPRDHDLPHPVNDRIPLLLSGPGVRAGREIQGASLLDVPPTVLSWFGVAAPASYEGRVLSEAFDTACELATAAVA